MIHRIIKRVLNAGAMGAALVAASLSVPAVAKVTKADDKGFITRDTAVVEAEPKAVWLALISPSKWWDKALTWSGDATNLTLRPQAGGCFCERIPENADSKEVTLEGSVEHLRVIQAFPEKVLRMRGGLGPLQSEPATGVLTITMGPEESGGTRIVWEYVVGGTMRYKVPVIAKVVDGVMTQQLNGLAAMLGRIDRPAVIDPRAEGAQEELVEPGTDEAPSEAADAKVDASADRMAELAEAVEALDEE